LAAVAIPVITTTIKSAKLSTMESNAASLNMMVKEAINCSKAKIKATTWGPDNANYETATIGDVALENDLYTQDQFDADDFTFYSQDIQGKTYQIGWDEAQHNIVVVGEGYATNADTAGNGLADLTIVSLEPDAAS
ncbi:MAG: hypothetical protein IIZ59_04305, partial [Clostridia bacterium]|nr:hypothetical protein [Clostridia bacterium]